MTGVWAIDLLPVVCKQPKGKAGRNITFSEEQDRLLIELREGGKNGAGKKEWSEIARVLSRPIATVHGRYAWLIKQRTPHQCEPKSLSAAAPRRPRRLHEDLGIKTCVVQVVRIDSFGSIRQIPITLSAGHQ